MSRQPDLYETFARSLAPSIFGNMGKEKKKEKRKLWGGEVDVQSLTIHYDRHQKGHYLFAV